MRTELVYLCTSVDMLKAFIHVLKIAGIQHLVKLTIVNDDRMFDIKEEIQRYLSKHRYIRYRLLSGVAILNESTKGFSNLDWIWNWKRGVKVCIPIFLHKIGSKKIIYLDDDTIVFRDPARLVDKYDFAAARGGVFEKYHNYRKLHKHYESVFTSIELNEDTYNETNCNSGACVINLEKGIEVYLDLFSKCYACKYMRNHFNLGNAFGDQPFYICFMKTMGLQVASNSEMKLNSSSPVSPNRKLSNPPIIFHYAVTNRLIPDWIDWFKSLQVIDGIFVSKYQTSDEFYSRKKVSTFSRKATTLEIDRAIRSMNRCLI